MDQTQPTSEAISNLQAEIREMVDRDQALRNSGSKDRDEWIRIDGENTKRVKEIVAAYGWPKISEFGVDTAHEVWLLVQHADRDPEFQKHCLELMNSLAIDEVAKKDIAYLTDRVMVADQALSDMAHRPLAMEK